MIIWSGYGFIIFINVFIDSLIAELISQSVTQNDKFYQENLVPLGISFIVSGAIIYFLKRYFDKKKANNEGTRIFDRVTISQKRHHLFFIPFEYWTYIMVVVGILLIGYQIMR